MVKDKMSCVSINNSAYFLIYFVSECAPTAHLQYVPLLHEPKLVFKIWFLY